MCWFLCDALDDFFNKIFGKKKSKIFYQGLSFTFQDKGGWASEPQKLGEE